ncbi:hypothetical protein KW500_18480 [Vibrio fluvialis]|nr:hypothetical protein [Vibrio fluvialis]
MEETIRIELTQDQHQQLKEIGVSNSEIKSYGCTHPSPGVTIDHYMTIGVKKPVTGGAEWDGEGLPPVGAIFCTEPHFDIQVMCKYSSKFVVVGEILPFDRYKGAEVVIENLDRRIFRKPETEAERNERERLEAAYDLYLTRHLSMPAPYRYDEFLKAENTLNGFLAIVDKTGYRKAVTNE